MRDVERRLEALEKRLPPAKSDSLAESFPDLDEQQHGVIAGILVDVMLAAVERLGTLHVGYDNELHGREADLRVFRRAVELAADDAASMIRSGGRPESRMQSVGPSCDPEYPRAIDVLLVRAGWPTASVTIQGH